MNRRGRNKANPARQSKGKMRVYWVGGFRFGMVAQEAGFLPLKSSSCGRPILNSFSKTQDGFSAILGTVVDEFNFF
jgi:hypothetical protein